MESKEVELKV